MGFALVIPRRPPSGSKGPNRKFREVVKTAAKLKLGAGVPLDGPVYARIIWFHRVHTTQDADNIAKNILDAIKGTVIGDDFSFVQVLTHRVDARQTYELSDRKTEEVVYQELLALLGGDDEHVLYLEIDTMKANKVVFGPIDGDSA
jgi:Endodeoxyribonuclease RusA